MKNPMDRQLEKRFSDRAVAIGREGNVAAFDELVDLLQSSSANARRLAASAELNKTIEVRDGAVVQSDGERRIAEWLTANGLAYRYDAKFRILSIERFAGHSEPCVAVVEDLLRSAA